MAASSLSASFRHLHQIDDAYSPLCWRLRWRVLATFGETSVGQALFARLRARFPLALTLRHDEINDAMILLERPDELLPAHRPRAAWRDANLWEYTRELMAVTKEIGLSGPRVWHANSDEPKPVWIDWVPLVHAYLRHPNSDNKSRTRWLEEPIGSSNNTSFRLPWSKEPYRGRGRPRSDDEPRLCVFAHGIGLALAGENWTSIAGFANGVLNGELTGGEVKTHCRRLARRLGVFRVL